jgi:sulfite exporter TauE/SafE
MSIALAGLAMGFLGSSHCFGMCGGIAAALSAAPGRPETRSIARACAVNVGRVASYAAAGAIAGALGASATSIVGPSMAFGLRSVAALLIIAAGLYIAGWSSAVLRVERVGASFWRRIAPHARRFRASASPLSALAFGALWGWVPCGLVYSALGVAAASGSASDGTLMMAAFGLGTMPATLAIGLAAGSSMRFLRARWTRRMAGALVVLFGFWTFAAAAVSWMATQHGAATCHVAAAPHLAGPGSHS